MPQLLLKINKVFSIYKFDLFMILVAIIIAINFFERPKGVTELAKSSAKISLREERPENQPIIDRENLKDPSTIEEDELNRTLLALSPLFGGKVEKEEPAKEPTLSEVIYGKAPGQVTLIGIAGNYSNFIAFIRDHRGQILTLKNGSIIEGGARVSAITPKSIVFSFKGQKREIKLYEKRPQIAQPDVPTIDPRVDIPPPSPPHFETSVPPPERHIMPPFDEAQPHDRPWQKFRRFPH